MRVRLLLALLLTTSACATNVPSAPSSGPYRFTGNILELSSGRTIAPIPNAELVVVSGSNVNARTLTDDSGHFSFDGLDSGRFTVSIEAPGYVGVAPVVALYRDIDANFGLVRR
ncbi:MAG: carboxypeptidase regulatory-like domain-containing protein [Acidobacteria bacterium]|nr:carboxypeptidase regulatory-like domain-containing protein [Acidobacteriota bacterium]